MSSGKNSHDHGISHYHDLDVSRNKTQQLKEIYADWASTYDRDNDGKLATVSQPNAVAILTQHLTNKDAAILDVGCGTGLVGHHLALNGFTNFSGTDLSQDMLDRAKGRGYRKLFAADAEAGLPVEDNAYDACLCVGVFTHGHVRPEGFAELLRVTRPGGIIVFTVNEGVWQKDGFDKAVAAHLEAGNWKELSRIKQGYMLNENVEAWYIAVQKTANSR